jgi:peptidoglycan/xylan/chitin deacetylase (PgdA/CDA1 family)
MTIVSSLSLGLAAAGTSLVAVGSWGVFHPRSQIWGPLVHRGPRTLQSVALTFDDGPHPDATPAILDALADLGVRAAFFVIGAHAARWPRLVRRMVDEGHVVGNHSYDHHRWGSMWGVRYWRDQIGRTQDLVAKVAGRRPAFFRPPMGFKSLNVSWVVRSAGMTQVSYSLRGFDGFPTTPARVLERLLPKATAGDIIALHDGRDPYIDRPRVATRDSIRPLIGGLRERGLEVVRLDHLIDIEAWVEAPVRIERSAASPRALETDDGILQGGIVRSGSCSLPVEGSS